MFLSLGEVLVEVMRDTRGEPLSETGRFVGPFASGAPAIAACAAARLRYPSRFIGASGADAFGELCERYLKASEVDTQIRKVPGYTTGIAFVSYDLQGGREFVFHLPQSAAAHLSAKDIITEVLSDVRWLHITGSSLGVSESVRQAVYRAVELAKRKGVAVSFDPNLRLELMSPAAIRDLCEPVLRQADVILPSASEASHLTGLTDDDAACQALLNHGAKLIILKRGELGSVVYTPESVNSIPSISVTEIDPTGAGDCFAAAFAVATLEGQDSAQAAHFANVAAALSTTAFGPMEGLPTRSAVEAGLKEN
jgi:sugar/nucleoside kinase (ribokinase family)